MYNPEGINPDKLLEHKRATGSVVGFPGAKEISNEELLELPVTILIPGAIEEVITGKNADSVQARIISEGANGPTTPEADKILHEKGVLVIPDILANAGGVTTSYLEWVQNLNRFYWSKKEVLSMLESRMVSAFNDVFSLFKEKDVDMRTAAYMIAVSRVVEAMRIRGIWP